MWKQTNETFGDEQLALLLQVRLILFVCLPVCVCLFACLLVWFKTFSFFFLTKTVTWLINFWFFVFDFCYILLAVIFDVFIKHLTPLNSFTAFINFYFNLFFASPASANLQIISFYYDFTSDFYIIFSSILSLNLSPFSSFLLLYLNCHIFIWMQNVEWNVSTRVAEYFGCRLHEQITAE